MNAIARKYLVTLFMVLSVADLLHAGSAMAAAAKPTGKSKVLQKKKKSPQTTTPTNISEAEVPEEAGSSKKQVLANAGLAPSPFFGFGATFATLNANRSGFEADFTTASGKSGTIVAQVTHFGGRYRAGLGKLVYVAGGAGFRMAKGSWYVLNQTADAEYQAGATLNAVTLDGALGAQLKFGSVLIGADLAGISFPLFKMGVKNTKPSEEDYDTSDADTQQGKFDKVAAGMTLTIAKVGVGIEF